VALAVTNGAPRAQQQAAPQPNPQQPTFRVSVDLVTTDVIVRDSRTGQFVSDLKTEEFEVYEDGVKQEIVSLVLTHGGRVFNVQAPPPAPVQEGIILPAARPTNDAAGRVFLIFIDDLHLDFRLTPRTRDLMGRMLKNLVHEGDMFGIVSTGTSSMRHGQRAASGGSDQDSADVAGSCGAALPRACGVFHRLPADAESRAAAQPAQGGHLHQQRVRLQSIRAVAPEIPGGDVRINC
jgi:hypothetical protein